MSVAERAVAASVSVVVPCFNQARFLPAALTSVFDQELDGDVECIVVDDGSTDDTQSVARDHGATLLAQENRGLAAARNRGLEAACGSLVVFLDADDRLTPDALSVNVSALATRPDAAFVSGHCTLIGPDGTALYTPAQHAVNEQHHRALLTGSYIWNPGSVLYRKDCLAEIGGFEPAVSAAADYDLYLRLARSNEVVAHTKVTVEYRQHTAQMSLHSEAMLAAVQLILERERARWRDETYLHETIQRTQKAYQIYYGDPLVIAARSVLADRLARAERFPPSVDPEAHRRAYDEIVTSHRRVLEAFSLSRELALGADSKRAELEQRRQELQHEIEAAC